MQPDLVRDEFDFGSCSEVHAIARRALELLKLEEDPLAAMARAEFQMYEAGLQSALGVWRKSKHELEDFVADAIVENLLLPDWLRAKEIGAARIDGAQSFEDLMRRLTPTRSLD